jgi:hypothetical protein
MYKLGWCELDRSDSGEGNLDSSSEEGNELSNFIKCWENIQLVGFGVVLSSIKLVNWLVCKI